MSSIDNIKQQASEVFADCKQTIQTNWEKHKVKILVGAAIFGGGVLLIVTGGLAALPEAAAAALFFSGSFATIGGFAFTGYSALHSDNENSETQSSTTTSVADDKKEDIEVSSSASKLPASSSSPIAEDVPEKIGEEIGQKEEASPLLEGKEINPVPPKTGTIVSNLMANFLGLPLPAAPSSPILEEHEIVSKQPDAIPCNSNEEMTNPKKLAKDDVPEEMLLVREDEAQTKSTSTSSMSSYIPSSQTTKKLIGYTLLAAAAIAATKYGIDCWNQLPEEEQQAYLSQLRDGAEYLGTTVQQGFSKMASSLNVFSQEDNSTATNRFNGSLNSCKTLDQLDVSKRGYFEYYGPRMMDVANHTFSSVSSFLGNIASSAYNSLPSGESVAEKLSSNAPSWGNSLEDWTQWASNADPVGSMVNSTIGQSVQTYYSAASEYFTSEARKLTLEEMGVPFVDLTNVEEPLTPTQQGVLQTIQELTTCSTHKQIAAEMPSLDYLLSISGNK